MKIKSIKISGMHRAHGDTFLFNATSPYTYLNGPNGAGKSTVLQAIQFGLLGYVPESGKTKDATFSHQNGDVDVNGCPFMESEMEIRDTEPAFLKYVKRTFTKKKSKIEEILKSSDDSEVSADALIGDLQLPVFNFNEFIGMSPNKLKDYFISVFPDSLDSGISIAAEMLSKVPEGSTSEFITEHIASASGIPNTLESCRSLHEEMKGELSALKVEIQRLEMTLQSLVYYDDCPAESLDDIQPILDADYKKLDEMNALVARVIARDKNAAMVEDLKNRILPDEEMENLESRKVFLDNGIKMMQSRKMELVQKLSELQAKSGQLKSVIDSKAVCPYTKSQCDKIMQSMGSIESEFYDIAAEISRTQTDLKSCDETDRNYCAEMSDVIADLDRSRRCAEQLASLLKASNDVPDALTAEGLSDQISAVSEEIRVLSERKVHLIANQQYDEMCEKMTAQKFESERNMDILKEWIRLTDVNGLQAKFADAPFRKFEARVSDILKPAFGDSVSASFETAEGKFSFGIVRDGKYIRYATMSSGEKCVFNLALLIALTECRDNPLKLILIDDIFDHLDDTMIEKCFIMMEQNPNIQYIVAGVKPCPYALDQTIMIGG